MPIMAGTLALFLTGTKRILPLLAGSKIAAALSVAVFESNIFVNLKRG